MRNFKKRKDTEVTFFFSNGSSLKIPLKEDIEKNKPGMGKTTATPFEK